MRLSLVLFFLVIAGCAGSGEALKKLNSSKLQGSEFSIALALEYKDLANSEADKYSWANSEYFAEKGLKAAYGEEVGPENPADHKIADGSELQTEYTKLLTLRSGNIDKPQELAKAQMLYDCWLNEARKNSHQAHLDECRDEYFYTVEKLKTKPKAKKQYKKIIYKVAPLKD